MMMAASIELYIFILVSMMIHFQDHRRVENKIVKVISSFEYQSAEHVQIFLVIFDGGLFKKHSTASSSHANIVILSLCLVSCTVRNLRSQKTSMNSTTSATRSTSAVGRTMRMRMETLWASSRSDFKLGCC